MDGLLSNVGKGNKMDGVEPETKDIEDIEDIQIELGKLLIKTLKKNYGSHKQ